MVAVNYDWDEVEDNVDEEYDDSATVTAEYTNAPYLYGDLVSQRREDQSRFYCFDGQGSTIALTDPAGNVTDTNAYTTFGELTQHTGSTVTPFHYVGEHGFYQGDVVDIYLIRQQLLSSRLGRWLSPRDATHFTVGTAYAYAVIDGDDNSRDSDVPGGKAASGNVCAVTAWMLPKSSGNQISDPLNQFNLCQSKCAAPVKGRRKLGIVNVDEVIELITADTNKCCTLYFCGHQGGDRGNLGGGMTFGGPDGDTPVFILGPKATEEDKFRDAFARNGCKDCVINIYACGGVEYTKEEAEQVRKNRQAIADNTGCTICGSKLAVGLQRGKDDGGILGSRFCPKQAGRPPWIHECVEPKKPLIQRARSSKVALGFRLALQRTARDAANRS